ncbi:MAG: hypothetical protein RR162_04680, partial [Oscillospiraceae bacterium]
SIGTGCLLDGVIPEDIVSLPLEGYSEKMTVGWIKLKSTPFTGVLEEYVEKINEAIAITYAGQKRKTGTL